MLHHCLLLWRCIPFIAISVLSIPVATGAEVTPQHFGAITDDGIDDSYAIQQAITALKGGDSLFFPAGRYDIAKPLYAMSIHNSRLYGEVGSQLVKMGSFTGEYLLQVRNSHNITIDHLTFQGLTSDPEDRVWGEQGVFLGSTRDARVADNIFQDFGDACLRVTTADEPPEGVYSFDAVIERNQFLNCNQVTTTQVNEAYGATQNITFQWNYFEGLKGSLKLCSRQPVSGGVIRNNLMLNNKKHGIEVCSYSQVLIEGNYIKDTQGYAINYYENRNFDWNDHTIHNNVIEDSEYGLGFWAVMPGSTYGPVDNTQITGNCFANIRGGDAPKSVIRLTSKAPDMSYRGVNVEDNQFYNVSSRTMVSIAGSATEVSQSDNREVYRDCVPWGIRYLGTANRWLRYHNHSFYRLFWESSFSRLSQ